MFDNAINAVQQRLSTLTANSPFSGTALQGASPFAGGMQGASPFTKNPLQSQSPFSTNPLGGGGPRFAGFGGTGQVFGSPFGNVGSPFGANPLANTRIANPFMASEDDPFGTGIPGIKKPTATAPVGGGVNFAGPATSDDNKSINAQAIDGLIARTNPGSPLAGMGAFILAEANAKGVSVPMLLGIMKLESQLGTSGSYLESVYNYGGLTGTGWRGQTGSTTGMARAFATFATKEDGVRALIDNLASSLYKGKSVQQQIGLWYLGDENAGLGATDEQGNATMQQYLNTVASMYQGLGVGYNPTAKPNPIAFTGNTAGGKKNQNWEQIAFSFTREGGKWVDYNQGGIRITGNPMDGMDCSSFVGYALGLDRNIWTAQAEFNTAQRAGAAFTDWSKAQKGDLIFFQGTYDTGRGETVTHVGIYLGNGKMIHTGTPGRGVEVVDLNTAYWQQHFYGFGRF